PRRPNLHRQARRFCVAATLAQVHQQVAKPPRTTAVGQTTAQEPHLVPALHPSRGIHRVHLPRIQFSSTITNCRPSSHIRRPTTSHFTKTCHPELACGRQAQRGICCLLLFVRARLQTCHKPTQNSERL